MKELFFTAILTFCLVACKSSQVDSNQDIHTGIYKQEGSTKKLELKPDGNYILYNSESNKHFVIEQCEYASKGKWKQLAYDIIEITSEDYYLKQEGFKYDLIKENKFSQDTLYLNINLPADFLYYRGESAVDFTFRFNSNTSKSITSNKRFIKIPKEKYLWHNNSINEVSFYIDANISGTELYNSRIMFKIFRDYIDTGKYNYLTFTLPNFDLCFFEFEPLKQVLIYLKNENELVWQGDIWKKVK